LGPLGDYEVLLLHLPARGAAVEAFAEHVVEHFSGLGPGQTTPATN